MLTSEQKRKKRIYIRYVLFICCLLIPLFSYLQSCLLEGTLSFPISSTILILALVNINGLLLLLMLFLVLRNLVELVFERKNNILGSKLRSRLVVSFVSLSLVPTILLFLVALRLMSTSMDYWFNTNVEESLQASLKLAQSILQQTENRAEQIGDHISRSFDPNDPEPWSNQRVENLFKEIITSQLSSAPDALTLVGENNKVLVSLSGGSLAVTPLPEIPSEALRHVLENNTPETITRESTIGELVQNITPLAIPGFTTGELFLVTTMLIPTQQMERMEKVSYGITDYRQLVMLKAPIKLIMLIMLLITTMLIVFGAIWFGFRIAASLTGPINDLADATRRVADGELDFTLEKTSDDEMGLLVESFNRMTSDLSASNRKLAEAHNALRHANLLSEQRRRYIETILKNVAAGVIAINEHNEITAINRFAEELLKINPADFLHRDFHDVLIRTHVAILENFIKDLGESRQPFIERHVRVTVRKGETFSLMVNITRLENEYKHPLGYVIVFDNLTKLEKAQRLAAWQEVARRIAHEIKNPLTPIQLSAQRLRKRYMNIITDDLDIFDKCTSTIVNQVDEIKRLVSEFSDFARMPQVKKQIGNLVAMASETLVLYREAHKHITFTLNQHPDVPSFSFDPVQIKRVLINLLDNAVMVIPEQGEISITISLDPNKHNVLMEVADTGPGIDEQVKLRLFEPYFSTRKSGTGLGLAIANTIVTEHNGSIKVRDNLPSGAVFTVELPVNTC
ncbi:MAG: ATP-binding protein [Desulfobulbaceae bacterium]|nr:ATP-binding protein [Desulfobulbaceae bacterium]